MQEEIRKALELIRGYCSEEECETCPFNEWCYSIDLAPCYWEFDYELEQDNQ